MISRVSAYFFFVLLLCAVVASVFIFLPFLTPIILGIAASVIAYPVYRWFSKLFGVGKVGAGAARTNLAAFLTVLILVVVVVVPVFFLISRMYVEVQSLYTALTDESERSVIINSLNSLSQSLSNRLFNVFPAYSFDSLNITEYMKGFLIWIFGNLDKIFTGVATVAIYLFVFLLSMFYFLRDGAMIKRKFVSWSPLLDNYDEYITITLKKAILSVFGGTVVVALIQGILTGFGFWIFGVPAPAVWGAVASIAAFIPGIGTSLVIVPGILYLVLTGNYPYAVGLTIWGTVAVGLIDNILGPHLINKGVHIHPFLILISVLGGLSVFGPVGFVLGPLILSLLFALLEIYRTSFTNIKDGE
ncbi:MAG: AI-2E family transporter [Candidatus Paceibacterota bacterium]